MHGDIIRGHTENIILSILKDKPMYGYEILEEIVNKTNHELELKKITLYKTLERMVKNELIEQFMKNDTKTNGGNRKYYQITIKGLQSLKESVVNWSDTKKIINHLISDLEYLSIGENTIYFDEVTSTNDIAKEMAKEKVSDGTVIVANSQIKGRGRLQREWIDESGKNLIMSIILYPRKPLHTASIITQVAAASVSDAIKDFGMDSKIKWPNDVLVGGKKISGVLVETAIENNQIEYVIVGIGMNVNMDISNKPIKTIASSFFNELGNEFSIELVKNKLIEKFNYYYNEFLKGNDIAVQVCRENSHIIGKDVIINMNNTDYKVKVIDIADDGKLIIEDENGNIEFFSLNEISLHKNY